MPDMIDPNATQVKHEQHESNTSDTPAIRVQRECDTSNMNATQVKNFGFDNNKSENIF